jgi:hypothetical protein
MLIKINPAVGMIIGYSMGCGILEAGLHDDCLSIREQFMMSVLKVILCRVI